MYYAVNGKVKMNLEAIENIEKIIQKYLQDWNYEMDDIIYMAE